MTSGNRMSRASSTVDFDHRVHTCSTRAVVQTRRITIFRALPIPSLPYFSPSPVFRSHVIDAPAKTPSIFRAHGSATCSAHKRMTSLQVVCNIECKSALNPLLATKTPCVPYRPWQWKPMTLRTEIWSFAEISCSQNFPLLFRPYGSKKR